MPSAGEAQSLAGIPILALTMTAPPMIQPRRCRPAMRRWLGFAAVFAAVVTVAAPARATFPGDNGTIALALDGITLINSDGSNQHLIAPKGGDPAWTADGSLLLFDYRGSIYSVNADGSGL